MWVWVLVTPRLTNKLFRTPDEETKAKPGPKPKKKVLPSVAVRRADSGTLLGLAAAVSSLKLSPAKRKQAAKKPRAKTAPEPKPKIEETEDIGSPDEVAEDDLAMEGEEINEAEKVEQGRGKGKTSKATAKGSAKKPKKGDVKKTCPKAKAKSMCKDKPAGKKRPCMESHLAKQWLAFREEQLKALNESHPTLGYHDKVKLVATRPIKLCSKMFFCQTGFL